jgi:hypothetical protein
LYRSLYTRIVLFTFAFLLFTVEPSLAALSATSVTSVTSWEEEGGTVNNAASQYLNLWTDGTFGGFRLDLEGYGRVTALEEEVEPGDSNPNRLYLLTLTVSDAQDRGALTLGRQFIPSLTGPVMLDGVHLSTGSGALTFNARWGQASDVDGFGEEEQKILGAGLDYVNRKGMHFTLDYGRTYNEGLLTELLAAEWTYSWHRHTKAYVLVNWDLMSRTIHESLFGTRLFFSDRFSMILEFSQNVQVFDSDSIYSVFAVDSAHTRSFSLLFTPSPTTRYVWDYAIESYQGDSDGRQSGVSGYWTPGMWKISAGLLQHKGFGGELTEITADISKRLWGRLRVGAGGDFSRTKNTDEETVISSLVHTGARWDLSSRTSLDLRLEQVNDELTEATRSLRVSLKVEF